MTQMLAEITSVSSKGQVVLPISIRNELNIQAGTKLIVFSDGDNILLKPIPQPDISEFRSLLDASQQWAADVGLSEDDINDAIRTVRSRKKAGL